jgi:hypothetical protein
MKYVTPYDSRPTREARVDQAVMVLGKSAVAVYAKFTEDEIAWAYDLNSYIASRDPKGYWL